MPARPVILADAVALAPIGTAAESTYAIGDVISLTLQSTTGYTSFAWRLIGFPAGSAAALSSTSGYTSSLTIDVAGEYRIQGVATGSDGTSSARVSVIVVLTPNRALRKVDRAAIQTNVAAGLDDLVEKWNEALDTLDSTVLVSGAQSIVSRAALRALDVSTLVHRDVVNIGAAASAGDGWAGSFYYDSGSAAADDGALTIAPTVGSGRFKRIYSGPLDVRWFGAVGDGVTDDTTACQAAHTAAAINGATVFYPEGTFKITSTLTHSYHSAVRGVGHASILSFSGTGPAISCVTPSGQATEIQVDSIRIVAAAPSATCALYLENCYVGTLRQVYVDGANTGFSDAGIVLVGTSPDNCAGVRIENCHVQRATGYGVRAGGRPSGGIWLSRVRIQGCADYAIKGGAAGANEQELHASHCILEGNLGALTGAFQGASLSRCHMESMPGTADYMVKITGDDQFRTLSITDCFIQQQTSTPTDYAVMIDPTVKSRGFVFERNTVIINNGTPTAAVFLQNVAGVRTGPNWCGHSLAGDIPTLAVGTGVTGLLAHEDTSITFSERVTLSGGIASPLTIGTSAASTGTIRLPNGSSVYAKSAGGSNWALVQCTGGDVASFGDSTVGPTQVIGKTTLTLSTQNYGVTMTDATRVADWTYHLKLSGGVGFFGMTPVTAKPNVTGSRGSNAALASLLTQLASLGLITDGSS